MFGEIWLGSNIPEEKATTSVSKSIKINTNQ